MPLERNGEVYVTASEAARYLGISRETFYNNVQPQLQAYQLGAFKRFYYRRSGSSHHDAPGYRSCRRR